MHKLARIARIIVNLCEKYNMSEADLPASLWALCIVPQLWQIGLHKYIGHEDCLNHHLLLCMYFGQRLRWH